MNNADEIAQLQEQLATHRATLAHQLTQRAYFDPGLVPSHLAHGIVQARTAIAQLKADLRGRGVAVDDQPGDVAGPEEALLSPPDPAAAQALLDTIPLDVVPEVVALPTPHRMPLPANPRFVGRTSDLMKLAGALRPGGVAAITTGIGGVGKTQLASEFAHRYGQFFLGGVFWLSFADPAGIDTEIAACGGAGGLGLYADADKLEIAEQIAKVYQAWEQPIPRLLIFDNCEDEALLAARLPRSGGCRVLVTSRSGQWRDPRVATHALGTLSRPESVALLRGYRADLSEAEAGAIAELLGDLPLALSLAGSYLQTYAEEEIGRPATYLKNVEKALLEHRSLQGAGAAPSLTGHEQHVKATFEVSLKRLRPDDQVDALALAALARAARLAPGEAFPRELLLATLGKETEDEEEIAQRSDALRRLVGLGLLERAEEGALRMHRLLSAFARAAVQDEGAQGAVERALTNRGNATVNAGFPSDLQPIIAHLRHAMAVANQRGDAEAAALANALGRTEKTLTNYAAARPLYERALSIREKALGPLHPDIAQSLNNLAGLLESLGDYGGARLLYERALAIWEQVLGPPHHPHRTPKSRRPRRPAALRRAADRRDHRALRGHRRPSRGRPRERPRGPRPAARGARGVGRTGRGAGVAVSRAGGYAAGACCAARARRGVRLGRGTLARLARPWDGYSIFAA